MCLGLANGYIEPKEEKVSLLKPYTNNDRINDMSLEERAKILANIHYNVIKAVYEILKIPYDKSKFYSNYLECIKEWKQWLESEAEQG